MGAIIESCKQQTFTKMKGKTNNPNGRPIGSKNKATADIRQRISDFVNNKWESIEVEFEALEGKEKLLFFEKMLQYTLPKLQGVTLKTESDEKKEKPSWLTGALSDERKH